MIGTGLGDLTTRRSSCAAPATDGFREYASAALLSTEIPFDGAPEPVVRSGGPLRRVRP